MTTELKEVMAFLIQRYPKGSREHLSNARLTKLVYLSDWHFALKHKKQITGIEWFLDTYGPYVKDIEKTARDHEKIFVIDYGNNRYGLPKKTFSLRNEIQEIKMGEKEKISLKHIINITRNLYWRDFINLIYSTYPVRASERYQIMDLVRLANEYKELQAQEA